MGEGRFLQGISLITTTKERYEKMLESNDSITEEQRESVKNELMFMTDFQLVLNTANSDKEMESVFRDFLMLLLPKARRVSLEDSFVIISWIDKETEALIMTATEFESVAEIVPQILLSNDGGEQEFNPSSDQAAQIAAKIQARRDIVAKEKGLEKKQESPIGTAVSIISTSDGIPISEVVNYTLPQLFMQLDRTGKLQDFQTQITLGVMGGLKDVDIVDWKESI